MGRFDFVGAGDHAKKSGRRRLGGACGIYSIVRNDGYFQVLLPGADRFFDTAENQKTTWSRYFDCRVDIFHSRTILFSPQKSPWKPGYFHRMQLRLPGNLHHFSVLFAYPAGVDRPKA